MDQHKNPFFCIVGYLGRQTMPDNSETKQREINQVLSEITSALVGQFVMRNLLSHVVDTSRKILNAEVCSIFLEDREKEPGYIRMMAGSGFAQPLVGIAKYQIGEGFTGYVAKYGQKLNIHTREELESLQIEGRKIWMGKHDTAQWPSGQSQFRNLIAVPLRIKEQILGVIKVENKNEKVGLYFTDEDENYFETIANVVALAIENARLHERVEKQLKTIAVKASHRIGNQVTNYDGLEYLLQDEIIKPVPDRQALDEIKETLATTTRNLKRMVEEFKNYGKPLRLDKQSVAINEIIKNEARLASPPSGTTINLDLGNDMPKLFIDGGRFAEAVKELFKNSLKAIKKRGGTGEIRASTCYDKNRSVVVIKIEDNGPGFPLNFPIFEPFQATDTDSTGLGLVTVKELVELHNGSIKAEKSNSLKGACIEIELPVVK
jgi:signal transduction histidine kinase